MEEQRRHQRKGQKRKLEDAAAAPSASSAANEDDEEGGGEEICCRRSEKALIAQVRDQVEVLDHSFSWRESDRAAAKRAAHILAQLAKSEDNVNVIVDGGAVPSLVKHLREPEPLPIEGNAGRPFEHDVEKGSAFALSLLAVKPEHQQLIVDAGALPLLVDLLKRHRIGCSSRAVNSVIRRAADAITNLAHENSSIKTCVRLEGGIPPLVELLEFKDQKVQRAAAGALQTLAFKNDENNNQIVDCGALPTLILMLRSEDAAIHYEAAEITRRLQHSGQGSSASATTVDQVMDEVIGQSSHGRVLCTGTGVTPTQYFGAEVVSSRRQAKIDERYARMEQQMQSWIDEQVAAQLQASLEVQRVQMEQQMQIRLDELVAARLQASMEVQMKKAMDDWIARHGGFTPPAPSDGNGGDDDDEGDEA